MAAMDISPAASGGAAGTTAHDSLPLAERAYQSLRGKILRCEFEPGEKLKMETLQRDHGLSSSPLREALNRLVTEGLVRSDERRGFFASHVSVDDLRDVTRLRLMLDSEALVESMRVGDDHWEAYIVAAQHGLAKIEARSDGSPLTLNADWSVRHREFHLALLAATTSPKLMALCASLFDQAERYRRLSMRYRKEPRHKAAEHRRIMEAVLARDEATALALLREHTARTADNVEAAMARVPALTGYARATTTIRRAA